MSKNHVLKIAYDFYESVERGEKLIEIRLNDRDYQKGDTLTLEQLSRDSTFFKTGKRLTVNVTHVLSGWGIKEGYVAMSITTPSKGKE